MGCTVKEGGKIQGYTGVFKKHTGTTILVCFFGACLILNALTNQRPLPVSKFHLGDVVSFVAAPDTKGVVRELHCIRGQSACTYTVRFETNSKYRFTSAVMDGYELSKVN